MESGVSVNFFDYITEYLLCDIFKKRLEKNDQLKGRLICKRIKDLLDKYYYEFTIKSCDEIWNSPNIKIRNLELRNHALDDVPQACSFRNIEKISIFFSEKVNALNIEKKCTSVKRMVTNGLHWHTALTLNAVFPNLKDLSIFDTIDEQPACMFNNEIEENAKMGNSIKFMGDDYDFKSADGKVIGLEEMQKAVTMNIGNRSELESLSIFKSNDYYFDSKFISPWLPKLRELYLSVDLALDVSNNTEIWNVKVVHLNSKFFSKLVIPKEKKCEELTLSSDGIIHVDFQSSMEELTVFSRELFLSSSNDVVINNAFLYASTIHIDSKINALTMHLPTLTIGGKKVSYENGCNYQVGCNYLKLRTAGIAGIKYALKLVLCIQTEYAVIGIPEELKEGFTEEKLKELIFELHPIDQVRTAFESREWRNEHNALIFLDDVVIDVKRALMDCLGYKNKKRLHSVIANDNYDSKLESIKKKSNRRK